MTSEPNPTELRRRLGEQGMRNLATDLAASPNDIPSSLRNAIRQELREQQQPRGFQDPLKAPQKILTAAFCDLAGRSDHFLWNAAYAWLILHPDLSGAVGEYLPEGESTFDAVIVDEHVAAILKANDGLSASRVEIAFACFATGFVIDSVAEEDDVHGETSSDLGRHEMTPPHDDTVLDSAEKGELDQLPSRLLTWLEELKALPAEAPEWLKLETFAKEIQSLAEQKWEELHLSARQRLRQTVHELIPRAAVHHLRLLTDAEIDSLSSDHLEAAKSAVEGLGQLLSRFEAPEVAPKTTAEELQRLKDRIGVLSEAQGLQDDLSNLVVQSAATPDAAANLVDAAAEGDQESAPAPIDIANQPEQPEVPTADEPLDVESIDDPLESDDDDAGVAAVIPDIHKPVDALQISTIEESAPRKPKRGRRSKKRLNATVMAEPERITRSQEATSIDFVEADSPAPIDTREASPIWELLIAGDWEGAYWLAWATENSGGIPAVPSWLLAFFCGSDQLTRGATRLTGDLFAIVRDRQIPDDRASRALAAGAAIVTALTHPEVGSVEWLVLLEPPYDAFNRLIDLTREFTALGRPLTSEDIEKSQTQGVSEQAIREQVNEAQRWLNRARSKRFVYGFATSVFAHLVGPTGSIYLLLKHVIDDRRDSAKDLLSELQQWKRRQDIEERIELGAQAVTGRSTVKKIDGAARDALLRAVEEAVEIGEAWARGCLDVSGPTRSSGWGRRVRSLLLPLENEVASAKTVMTDLKADGSSEIQGVANCLSHVIDNAERILHGTPTDQRPHPFTDVGLQAVLSARLLFHPGVPIQTGELGAPDVSIESAGAIRVLFGDHQNVPSLDQAIQGWTELGDFRWVRDLADMAGNETDRGAKLQQIDDALASKRRQAELISERASRELEAAVVEGTIDPDTRAGLLGRLDRLQASIDGDRPNLAQSRAELDSILLEIDQNRGSAAAEQSLRWQKLDPQLSSLLGPELFAQVRALVTGAIERRDTVTLDELFSTSTEAIQRRDRLPIERLIVEQSPSQAHDNFQELSTERDKLFDLLKGEGIDSLEKGLSTRRAHTALAMRGLPLSRQKQAAEAFAAWRQIKASNSRSDGLGPSIQVILRYLGFDRSDSGFGGLYPAAKGQAWNLWNVTLAPNSEAPVQQFGSELGGRLRLVCLWNRPGLQAIQVILREATIEREPVLVLYLSSMNRAQWDELVRHSQQHNWKMLLVDEVLFTYLARRDSPRIKALFGCTLPATSINPYVPYVAGNVPQEMFKGRQTQLRDLEEPAGPAIVYGGRQLGKSSLLRELARRVHRPASGQYCVLLDIRNLGAVGGLEGPDTLWARLANGLRELGLVKGTGPTSAAGIQKRLAEVASEGRLLVLLDEADEFLRSEAASGFPITSALKSLVDSSERRFKVVFAGLHNVERFASIPNQPLAHFGTPVLVGPLEPQDARKLIREPMEAIGYRFSDEAATLRILSVTNYHPGLIQIFCHRLVRHLRARKSAGAVPPYEVTVSDVDTIARDPEVIKEISDRFVWTLALDNHYGVLVRAMVIDQIDQRDGYPRDYTLADLDKLGRDWWPAGFGRLGNDELRSYVSELVGLWVLSESPGGHFKLRSPNLARLLGTKEAIERELEPFVYGEQQPGEQPELAGSFHLKLTASPPVFSTFTRDQLMSLRISNVQSASGASLVIGSDANGLSAVASTLRAVGNALGAQIHVEDIEQVNTIEAIDLKVKRTLRRIQGVPIVVVPFSLIGNAESLEALTTEALRLSQKSPPGTRLRIVLTIAPDFAAFWHEIELIRRQELEAELGLIVLQRWSREAVRAWLEEMNVPNTEPNVTSVLAATGGYHYLISHLQDLLRPGRAEPEAIIADFDRTASNQESEIAKGFRDALAQSAMPPQVLETYRQVASVVGDGTEKMSDVTDFIPESPDVAFSRLQLFGRLGWAELDEQTNTFRLIERVHRMMTE